MSNISGYKTKAYSENQKFFAFDPNTGSPSLIPASEIASIKRLSSTQAGDGSDLVAYRDDGTVTDALNRRTIYVGSVAELKTLSTNTNVGVFVSYSGGDGTFKFDATDLSTEVADDTTESFFIAPSSDATGASGAWVRIEGYAVSNQFSQFAPDYSHLFSTIDNRFYIRISGAWELAEFVLQNNLDSHVQTDNAHGLRNRNIAIGELATAVGTRAVAIGYGAEADSGIVIGRDCKAGGSAFSTILSSQSEIINNANDTSLRNNTIIGSVSSDIVDSENSTVLGCIGFVNGAIANSTNSFIANSPGSTSPSIDFADNSISIGGQIRGSSTNRIGGSTAIGHLSTANHPRATAIGQGAATTQSDQIVVGKSSDSVLVPGSFSVTGTKNFKIPHPVPEKSETHSLIHASYEGPVPGGTVYRYTVETVSGTATVDLPEYFKYLNKDEQVWCSPNGHFGQAYGSILDNTLTVTSNQDGKFEVLILATRNDAGVSGWEGAEVLNDNA